MRTRGEGCVGSREAILRSLVPVIIGIGDARRPGSLEMWSGVHPSRVPMGRVEKVDAEGNRGALNPVSAGRLGAGDSTAGLLLQLLVP